MVTGDRDVVLGGERGPGLGSLRDHRVQVDWFGLGSAVLEACQREQAVEPIDLAEGVVEACALDAAVSTAT